MSRTKKGSKSPGYDIWSKRPGAGGTGRVAKWVTKRRERSLDRILEHKAKAYKGR